MKKIIFLTAFLLFFRFQVFACCAHFIYNLYPIGEYNDNVVFVEFDLYRNCFNPTEFDVKYFISGYVNLVAFDGDSLIKLKTIDSVYFIECKCNDDDFYRKTNFERKLKPFFRKAVNFAKKLPNFSFAKPKTIIFNDSLNTKVDFSIEDTFVYKLTYKNLLTIDLTKVQIISCYPSKVAEVMTYETEHFMITVVRLRCSWVKQAEKKHIKKRFKRRINFWREDRQWHGITMDIPIVRGK